VRGAKKLLLREDGPSVFSNGPPSDIGQEDWAQGFNQKAQDRVFRYTKERILRKEYSARAFAPSSGSAY
jgi:hypothetical protein